MRKKSLLIFIALLFQYFYGIAQNHHCGTNNLTEEKQKLFPNLLEQQQNFEQLINDHLENKRRFRTSAVNETVYMIPVVVHVVHNNASGTIGGAGNTNISDAQVLSQIDILNEDFGRLNSDTNLTPAMFKPVAADTKIQFCLASRDPYGNITSGINRIYSSKSFFSISYSDEVKLKTLSYWPSDQYLNIWVCRLEAGYLGYAQFPGGYGISGLGFSDDQAETDGVVIDYRAFGNNGTASSPYNLGRTTTHEVGHWFGLKHIWGDAFCGDDYVADTPQDQQENGTASCLDSSTCTGPWTRDMSSNYLDYSDDACMNIFTIGQKDRMRAVIDISPRRKALLSSPGCCGNGVTVSIPVEVDFESNQFLSEGWTIINPDSLSAYSNIWTRTTPGGYGSSSYSLSIKNDSVYTSTDTTYVDYLESPFLNFGNSDRPVLDFDWAYAKNSSGIGTDSLVVSYNLSCNEYWTPLLTLYGNDLVTSTEQINLFSPSSGDWNSKRILLDALKNKFITKIRFENYSKGINKLYLDNINIYNTSEKLTLFIYPNPSPGLMYINLLFKDNKNITTTLYNSIGQKVFEETDADTSAFTKTINTSVFAEAIYILKVSNGEETVTKRVAFIQY